MTGDQHTDRIASEAGTDVPEGFLEGLSVLEWGEMVAAPYSAQTPGRPRSRRREGRVAGR